MKVYTKRLEKKYLKIAADRMAKGQELPQFYFQKVREHFGKFHDHQLLTAFAPMINEMQYAEDFKKAYAEHIEKTNATYLTNYGVQPKLLNSYYLTLKSSGMLRKQRRKSRKEKIMPPIRQLKNPRMYKIRVNGDPNYRVIGEPAFEYKGLQFFIHRFQDAWTVSNVESGLQVVRDDRYKRAVSRAKELVEKNFDAIKKNLKERGL